MQGQRNMCGRLFSSQQNDEGMPKHLHVESMFVFLYGENVVTTNV